MPAVPLCAAAWRLGPESTWATHQTRSCSVFAGAVEPMPSREAAENGTQRCAGVRREHRRVGARRRMERIVPLATVGTRGGSVRRIERPIGVHDLVGITGVVSDLA